MTYQQHKATLAKLLRQASGRLDTWRVFSDFVEMAAISIANSVMPDPGRDGWVFGEDGWRVNEQGMT